MEKGRWGFPLILLVLLVLLLVLVLLVVLLEVLEPAALASVQLRRWRW